MNSLIIENYKQGEDIDALIQTEVIYRICVVVDVMSNKEGVLETLYEKADEEDEYLEERYAIVKAIQKLLVLIKEGWKKQFEPEEYRNCSFYALIDKNIYDNVYQYLIQCQNQFLSSLKGDKKVLCEKIRSFLAEYKGNNDNNIESQVQEVEDFINEYKSEMLSKL